MHRYNMKSMRGGDYGGASSSDQLVKDMTANMRRVKTPAERQHAIAQVQYAERAQTITLVQAVRILAVINNAPNLGRITCGQ